MDEAKALADQSKLDKAIQLLGSKDIPYAIRELIHLLVGGLFKGDDAPDINTPEGRRELQRRIRMQQMKQGDEEYEDDGMIKKEEEEEKTPEQRAMENRSKKKVDEGVEDEASEFKKKVLQDKLDKAEKSKGGEKKGIIKSLLGMGEDYDSEEEDTLREIRNKILQMQKAGKNEKQIVDSLIDQHHYGMDQIGVAWGTLGEEEEPDEMLNEITNIFQEFAADSAADIDYALTLQDHPRFKEGITVLLKDVSGEELKALEEKINKRNKLATGGPRSTKVVLTKVFSPQEKAVQQLLGLLIGKGLVGTK